MTGIVLSQVFPDAHVIGVDLSPYFISVANFRAKKKVAPSVPFEEHMDLFEHFEHCRTESAHKIITKFQDYFV